MAVQSSVTAALVAPTGFVGALTGYTIVMLGIALLVGLPIALTLTYWVLIYPFFISPLRHIPGPKDNSWFFGQCHKFLQVAWVPQLFNEWSRTWPDSPFIRYLGLGNAEALLANSITSYREILQTKSSFFVKPDLTRRCANVVVGDGLPFAEGQLHRQRRAVLMKPFSVSRLKAFVPELHSKARRLADVLGSQRDFTGEVEVETSIWKTVLDVIGIETLGIDLNHLESEQSPLHNLFSRTMQQTLTGHIIHYLSSYLPLRHLIPINTNNDFLRSCSEVRKFLGGYVRSRRMAWDNGVDKGNGADDALQCMIEQGNWSDDDIVEYVVNLMVLGHDTTACTLVWATYILSRHLDLQHRLRNEITSLLSMSTEPTYSDIERLRFLDNFLREVLRVYCPVAFIPREATSEVEIAGVLLPKGTVVNLCPAIMNLHPLIWGADASSFNPDRWDHLEGDAASAYAFESFHNGPRMCIGKQLSMMEMKVMLIELVSRFRIDSLDNGAPTELASPSFTLRPKEKLRVRLTDIADSE